MPADQVEANEWQRNGSATAPAIDQPTNIPKPLPTTTLG